MDLLIASNSVPLASADVAPTSGTPQYATDGNPAAGVPPTIFPAYAFNAVMQELVGLILAAGLTPSTTNNAQVLQAIETLFAGLNGSSGQQFSASKILTQSVANASGFLSLEANTFTQSTNIGATSLVQHYCAPAASGSAATTLGQFPSSLATNGFKKWPDSSSPSGYFIEQWGTSSSTSSGTTITFPIAFPNFCLNAVAVNGPLDGAAPSAWPGIGNLSVGSFLLWQSTSSGVGANSVSAFWRAIGY